MGTSVAPGGRPLRLPVLAANPIPSDQGLEGLQQQPADEVLGVVVVAIGRGATVVVGIVGKTIPDPHVVRHDGIGQLAPQGGADVAAGGEVLIQRPFNEWIATLGLQSFQSERRLLLADAQA